MTPKKTEDASPQEIKNWSPDRIKHISSDLRNNPAIPDQAIFHSTAQLLGALNPQAKALFNRILSDPVNLTEAKAYLHELEGSEPILTHTDFFKIHDNTENSNNKILQMAQVFRENHGRNFIESNLEDALRAHSNMTMDHFDIVEVKMKISKKGWDFYVSEGLWCSYVIGN